MTLSQRAALSVAIAGGALTVAFAFYEGSPSDRSWWAGAWLFFLWLISPYVIVGLLSWMWTSSEAAQVLLALAALLAAGPVPFVLYDAFIAHHSSTNGLVFLFVPVYQLIVVIPLAAAAWWASRRGERQ